LSLRSFLF